MTIFYYKYLMILFYLTILYDLIQVHYYNLSCVCSYCCDQMMIFFTIHCQFALFWKICVYDQLTTKGSYLSLPFFKRLLHILGVLLIYWNSWEAFVTLLAFIRFNMEKIQKSILSGYNHNGMNRRECYTNRFRIQNTDTFQHIFFKTPNEEITIVSSSGK